MAIETQNLLTHTLSYWNDLSRSIRFLLIFGVSLLAILLANLSVLQQDRSRCQLFGNVQLSDDELEQIEFALHKSGFHDFETKSDTIVLPSRLRSQCLIKLEKQGVLPSRLAVNDSQPQISPFLAPSQIAELRRKEKKAVIERAIKRLDFVDQAWFATDVAKGSTAFQPNRHTAIIEVQPKRDASLDSTRIATLCPNYFRTPCIHRC